MKLTLERARELLAETTDDPKLLVHATNVRGCMEAFARRFGQPPDEVEHWGAVGHLHDYDYQRFPEEHLAHTESELLAAGVDPADVRAILSHGWGICNDVKPESDLEKSLYCADELSGLVWAAALMRPGASPTSSPEASSRSSRTSASPRNARGRSSGAARSCSASTSRTRLPSASRA